jgi:hypothetical protein
VDWNVLGGRIHVPVGSRPHPPTITLGVGRTTLASLVGYRWELYARADADVMSGRAAALFAAAEARVVTVEPDPALPRDGFTDLEVEAGIRVRRDRGAARPRDARLPRRLQHRSARHVRPLTGVRRPPPYPRRSPHAWHRAC